MFHWIIPYLVAYNVSEIANWRNEPTHYFEADVKAKLKMDDETSLHTEVAVLFACRPYANLVKCRIDNATIDNYEIKPNTTDEIREEGVSVFEDIVSVVFHVDFDRTGITKITFAEPRGYYCENVIRSIIGNLNVGIDLTRKNIGTYTAEDKSINGRCKTIFHVGKIPRTEKKVSVQKNLAVTKMWIPSSSIELSDTETVVVEKERKMNDCSSKTPYMFGQTEDYSNDEKKRVRMEIDVVSSRSKIYLETDRFDSYTEHRGRVKITVDRPHGSAPNRISMSETRESIKVSLVAIGPETDDVLRKI